MFIAKMALKEACLNFANFNNKKTFTNLNQDRDKQRNLTSQPTVLVESEKVDLSQVNIPTLLWWEPNRTLDLDVSFSCFTKVSHYRSDSPVLCSIFYA